MAGEDHRVTQVHSKCRLRVEMGGGLNLAFTFFFRDQHVLERVVDHVLPRLAGLSHPRFWDAGVAMGQEPYTLAIIVAEKMSHFSFANLRIDSTDVEDTGQFARIVEAGEYPDEELTRLPEGIRQKYFEPSARPGYLRVIDSIRRRIAFQRHDLLTCKEIGAGYSLVLCKNVLLHFQPSERIEVLRMFHRALAPGGLLATEQTQQLPPELAPLFRRVTPDWPVYCKAEGDGCES